jgi:chromodomain-helicase-DNA-binding protein 7
MGKVRVEKVGDRIWLKANYQDAGPTLAKSVPGSSWRGKEKVWTYPLNLHTCRDLRRVFKDALEIGPELTGWARNAVTHEESMSELGRQMDAELQHVQEISPILAKATDARTYQRSGARFVANGQRVLIADEPALGKTATALAGLMEAESWYGDHLIVTPLTSVRSTWARQIELWTDAEVFYSTRSTAQRKAEIARFLASEARSKFLVVNSRMVAVKVDSWCSGCEAWEQDMPLRNKTRIWPDVHYREHGHDLQTRDYEVKFPEIVSHRWTSAIVDECHELFAQYRPSNVTQVMEGMQRIQPEIRIALTGTPLRGYEKKLWGTLKWLEVVRGGFWAWVDTWLHKNDNGYGVDIGGLREERRDEFYASLDTYVRRLTKKETRPDLPEKEYIPVWVPLAGEHKKQYVEFLEQGEVKMSQEIVASLGPLSELTRLKQMSFGVWEKTAANQPIRPTAKSPKIEWLLQALAERGVTGNPKTEFFPEEGLGYKYVVASQFGEVVDAVERALSQKKIKTLKVTGSVTGSKRDAAVSCFQSDDDEYRVMLINTKAGGVSIDLDAWCDEMFILDETWVSDDQVQLEGRIDNRSGREANRTFYYIRTEETVEEAIAESNLSQDEMQKELLDRRRGAEVASRIIQKLRESSRK